MNSRKQISKILGISEQYVCMLLKGQRRISTNVSEKLADLLPDKTDREWRSATPEELRRAFDLLPEQALTNPSNEEAA